MMASVSPVAQRRRAPLESGSRMTPSPPDPIDEDPAVARDRLELARRFRDQRRAGQHRVRAILDVAAGSRLGLPPRLHPLLVAPALFFQIDAQQPRRELREEPGGPDHADEIGDRECDGNAVRQRRGLGRRQPEAPNRVARGADGRRLGERAGDDAGGRAGVVAEEPADRVRDDQPGGGDDRRQRRLLKAVTSETAEETAARS
jgi:hypothetical protein